MVKASLTRLIFVISMMACFNFSFANIPQESQQLILVVTKDWDSSFGMMQCFEKDKEGRFVQASNVQPIVVGKKGLGWGLGLHEDNQTGPIKQEGDSKGAAGIFKFGNAFGIKNTDTKFPFIKITPLHFAIDDMNSKYYNTIQNIEEVDKDWKSAEDMNFYTVCYLHGIEIKHNMPARSKEAGSCIYMHVWPHSRGPTAGCTATDVETIKFVLSWLDPEKQPVVVQLPLSEYEARKAIWNLPDLKLALDEKIDVLSR